MSTPLRPEVIPLEQVPRENQESSSYPMVMVVDDETLVADTLVAILRHDGFAAVGAYDGVAALRRAETSAPDLLISDVAMPGMSGVELAVEVLAKYPKCKILLFSGHATSASLVNTVDGHREFLLLAKPVHPTELLKLVAKVLGVERRPLQPAHLAPVFSIRRSA